MIAGGASLAPRRWSLAAEATDAQQAAVLVHRADDRGAEDQELRVVVRGVAGHRAGCPCVGLPSEKFTCLPEPLTPAKGFSWKQALHAVLARPRALKVVISSCWWSVATLAALEHRRDLELAGGDLVVAGLDGDAELEQLPLGVHHEAEHALGDGAEVVVVELLALRRLRAEQGAAGVQQVRTGQEEVAVDQEVLLLGAAVAPRRSRVLVPEERQHAALACTAIACCERSSGVLWSRASPVIEMKTVGMQRVLPLGFSRMYAGLITSQPV